MTVVVVILCLAAVAFFVLWCALRIDRSSVVLCAGGCGRVVEPFTGIWDASRRVFCSKACAEQQESATG